MKDSLTAQVRSNRLGLRDEANLQFVLIYQDANGFTITWDKRMSYFGRKTNGTK